MNKWLPRWSVCVLSAGIMLGCGVKKVPEPTQAEQLKMQQQTSDMMKQSMQKAQGGGPMPGNMPASPGMPSGGIGAPAAPGAPGAPEGKSK